MSATLDNLRRSAKLLRKAIAAGDPAATARLRAVLTDVTAPRHADVLQVVAVEHGHESWPKLKLALEAGEMTVAERADRLKKALFHGQGWVIEKLLGAEPALAHFDLAIELALYDLEAVRARIAADPAAARTENGGRTPLVHLCFSRYHKCVEVPSERILAVAELLRANGASANESYAEDPSDTHRQSALYGALGHGDNMPLAAWLLEHGADPDDNESLYHSVELEHLDGLRLLCRYGVNPARTNALARALDFDRIEAVRILLEHGADPNEGLHPHPSGQPPVTFTALHQAARRGRSGAFAELLLEHGAEPRAVWNGRTAYALACLYGNRDFARVLEARGCGEELPPEVAVLASCAGGGEPAGDVRGLALGSEDRKLAVRIAGQPGALPHLKALFDAGLDPDETDEMALTPLHAAGWNGQADQVAYLLTLKPNLSHRNRFGGDAIGTVIHGAEFAPPSDAADYLACARLLLEAGARFPEEALAATGSEEMGAFLSDWRETHGIGGTSDG
ncbi:ankyrin repeat domain-containing protein [Nisaea sediminum]|uniref:ankyrin repeat domain-containing protein n=1 Tax=Nisaea sediminum TaxID=2775867 RepID=UPI00186680C7|nr:ankyrin repeat domain-containing protein [Nisaea sediminum]